MKEEPKFKVVLWNEVNEEGDVAYLNEEKLIYLLKSTLNDNSLDDLILIERVYDN